LKTAHAVPTTTPAHPPAIAAIATAATILQRADQAECDRNVKHPRHEPEREQRGDEKAERVAGYFRRIRVKTRQPPVAQQRERAFDGPATEHEADRGEVLLPDVGMEDGDADGRGDQRGHVGARIEHCAARALQSISPRDPAIEDVGHQCGDQYDSENALMLE